MEQVLRQILNKARYSGVLPLNHSFHIEKLRLTVDMLINFLVIWEFLILTINEPLTREHFVVSISLLFSSSFIVILITSSSPVLLMKRNYLMKMVEDLVDADNFLNSMGLQTAYHSSTISYILLNLTPSVLVCYFFTYFFEFLSLAYLLAISFHFLIISRMFAMVEMAVQFMNNMNRLLNGLCMAIERLPSEKISKTLPNLNILINCHCLVCDSSQCLNKFFGYNILLLFAINLAYVIVHIYFFYLKNSNTVTVIIDKILRIMWIIMYIMWTVRITNESQLLTVKSKEFNVKLYTMMLEDKTYLLCNNEKLCLHIAMKNEAVMSACGFFNVNNSLMHSMVAAATSYLVMVIQLDRQMLTSRYIGSSRATMSFSNTTIDYLPSS